MARDGLEWRHKLYARAELQNTNGVTTTERVLASAQSNYKFAPRGYAFGLAQYERDPFAGYDARYNRRQRPRLRRDRRSARQARPGGRPAFRYTQGTDGFDSKRLVGRGSLSFNWQVTPTLQFVQNGAIYLEQGDSNANRFDGAGHQADRRPQGPLLLQRPI